MPDHATLVIMPRARRNEPRADCRRCGDPIVQPRKAGRPRLECERCSPPKTLTRDRRSPARLVAVDTPPGVTIASVDNLRAEDLRQTGLELRDPAPRDGFDERGRSIWAAWHASMPTPGHLEMLREYCRLADRAERMHNLLNGERRSWLALELGDLVQREVAGLAVADVEITVTVSSVAIEARNTAGAMRAIVAELRQATKYEAAGNQGGGDPLEQIQAAAQQRRDELADRRAGRQG